MADPQILTTLRRKRDNIERGIAAYEKKIKQARRDLANVNATLHLFRIEDRNPQAPVYVDTARLFPRGDLVNICKAALEKEGPLDTRELALRVVQARALDEGDTVLRQAITFRIVQALRLQVKRGKLERLGKRRGVIVWRGVASTLSTDAKPRV